MLGYYEYSKRQKREAGAAAEAAEDGDGEKSDSEEELLMITEGTPCWGVKTKKGLRGGGVVCIGRTTTERLCARP